MMIEDEFLSEKQLEEPSDQKNQIRWIACVNNVKAPFKINSERKKKLPKQRDAVFHKIEIHCACFEERMSIDVDAVDNLTTGEGA